MHVRLPPPNCMALNPKLACPPFLPAIQPPPVTLAPVPPVGPPLKAWHPSFGMPAMAPDVWWANHARPSPGEFQSAAQLMLARPSYPMATWKRSASVRSAEPPGCRPPALMLPRWMGGLGVVLLP